MSRCTVHPLPTHLYQQLSSTDIPDWVYCEAGLDSPQEPWRPSRIPTAEEYAMLVRASPIAHIGNVKCPLLMMVGGKDVRVPMAQSMDYYKILRARGVEARLLHFPDAQHALADSVKDDDEVWATVVSWFQQHVRRQLVQNVDNSCPG